MSKGAKSGRSTRSGRAARPGRGAGPSGAVRSGGPGDGHPGNGAPDGPRPAVPARATEAELRTIATLAPRAAVHDYDALPGPGEATAVRADQAGTVRDQPHTLCFDIGGTGLKASVLSQRGELLHDPVRVPTPYPLPPKRLVETLVELARDLPAYQRASAGFPGMVRSGVVVSAPHYVSPDGPGGEPSAELLSAWGRFDLQAALGQALGRPCRVANDADVQGAALVRGSGLELVVTLGTGVGTAMFWQGRLAPHLELAHHPLGRKGQAYNDLLGDAARKKVGNKKWNQRLEGALEVLRGLVFFDHCYIGGGNSRRVTLELPEDITLADNTAGILGGVKLWERS